MCQNDVEKHDFWQEVYGNFEIKICERYENIKLWTIWECKNYEWYENVKLWNIYENVQFMIYIIYIQ